jgi:transposase
MSTRSAVQLSDKERSHLKGLLRRGAAPARVQTRARVLLLSDRSRGERRTDEQVAAAVLTSVMTTKRTRWRFLREGLEAALAEKPRPGRPPKITGEIEAQLTVLACSQPPEGHAHWTLRLLAGRLVELGYLESISHVAVGNRLKKTKSSPGR